MLEHDLQVMQRALVAAEAVVGVERREEAAPAALRALPVQTRDVGLARSAGAIASGGVRVREAIGVDVIAAPGEVWAVAGLTMRRGNVCRGDRLIAISRAAVRVLAR